MRTKLLYIGGLSIVIGMIGIWAAFTPSGETKVAGQQDKGWKVWVKTSPCSGRVDWVSVAKENPTHGGGGGFWQNADLIMTGSGLKCVRNTDQTCSKVDAEAEAAIVRTSSKFSDYCCRKYSVWENAQSGLRSIVVGKFGTQNPGWLQLKGDLCCDEAEALSGLKGACSSGQTGANPGYVGCFMDMTDHDLKGFSIKTQNNTPDSCIAMCRDKNFLYAGLQYGETCMCGSSYGKYGEAANCNMPCSGNKNEFCGGFAANSVFSTGGGTPEKRSGIDLSGSWAGTLTDSSGCRSRWDLNLKRSGENLWAGSVTNTQLNCEVLQDGKKVSNPLPVTIEPREGGKAKFGFLGYQYDATYSADQILWQNIIFVRKK